MTTASDADRIARRYPRRRFPRWAWIPLAVATAVVGGIWLVWAAWYGSHPAVIGKVTAFQVVSDTRIDVTVTVQRIDPSQPARCEITSQAVTYDTVGELRFDVPPAETELTTTTVQVRTFKRATTAEVTSCVIVDG